VHEALLKNIKRRMTPQPVKIRADVELTCFAYDGVERIRDAMRAAEALGNEECPVRMKLVAPPLYVLTTATLDKAKGVEVRLYGLQLCFQKGCCGCCACVALHMTVRANVLVSFCMWSALCA
jgi:translation initiation factor 2 subunit 1